MRKLIFVFIFLGAILSTLSCKKDLDKKAVVLIEEFSMKELPVGSIRFQWQGKGGFHRQLIMWRDSLDPNTPGLMDPNFFTTAIPKNYQPINDKSTTTFELLMKTWKPTKNKPYYWRIDTYFEDGDVLKSDKRIFVPNPL
jgi:hypothetical protein